MQPELWIMRHRRVVIAGFVLLFAAALILGSTVGFELDVMKVLPAGDRAVSDYMEVLGLFRGLDRVLIDVSSPGSPLDSLTIRVAEDLSRLLPTTELIARVDGKVGLDEMAAGYEVLTAHRASLFSELLEEQTTRLLEPEVIDRRLNEIRRQLVSFPDPVTAKMFQSDPLGFDQLLLSLIPSPTGSSGGAQVIDGWLWSEDREHLLLLAEPTSTQLDSARSAELVRFIDQTIEGVLSDQEAKHVEVAHLSRFRAAIDNERMIKGDIARTLWISLGGILVVLVLTLGMSRRTLIVFLPAIIGGAVAMAVLAAVYGKVSPVVVGCGSILLGISVDYGIHLVFRAVHGSGGTAAILKDTARPIFLAAMTTGIAFLSLLASALPGHRQLGVFAAAGVLAAAGCSLLLLPLLLEADGADDSSRPSFRVADLVGSWVIGVQRWRGLALIVVIGVSVVAWIGTQRLQVETDLARFNGLSEQAADDSALISDVWGAALGQTSMVVSGNSLNEALARAGELRDHLGNPQTKDRVDAVQSIVTLLPDLETQQANRDRWARFWSESRVVRGRADLESAMARLGFRASSVAGFWQGLDGDQAPLEIHELQETPFGRVLDAWLSPAEHGDSRVLTRFTLAEGGEIELLSSELRAAFPKALLADGPQMLRHLSELVYSELKKMSLLSFVVVIVFLLPFSQSVRQPLVLVVILAVTFLWALGALGWVGVPITMMNSMIAIFIFGLTVDYTIFLMHAMSGSRAASNVAAAVVVSSATTMVGFGALLLARHPSLSSIGITTVIGIACGLTAAVVIVPIMAKKPNG